jgi:glycosyltransferase involved in cell wall biosynthesis
MNQKLLSALVIAHNEEHNLADCLRTLKFADEIIVVLDKCTDNSKQIAGSYADKIIEGSWDIEGARRNVGLQNCNSQWILEIDADERVSKDLANEILTAIRLNKPCRFIVPIANYIGSRYVKYGWLRTLGVTQRQTIHYNGYKKYHEDKQIHPTADVLGEAKYLANPIKHLVDQDIADMLNRFNRYTDWKANDIIATNNLEKSFWPIILSGIHRFFKSFLSKQGFREGRMGFIIAILCGLYPLVSYIKAKEKSQG